MTARVLLAACLAALPAMAAAQGAIQSGEHADHTRLVIPIGADRSYEIVEDGAIRRVIFDPELSHDTTRVFERIRRDRLADLSSDGTLDLTLACPCDLQSYRHDNRYLVIEIRDGPAGTPWPPDPVTARETAPAAGPGSLVAAAPGAAEPLTAFDPNGTQRPPMAQVTVSQFLLDGIGETSPPLLPGFSPVAAPDPIAPPDMPAVPDPDAPRQDATATAALPPDLNGAAQALAEQLARAASAGLLDAADSAALSTADPTTGAPEGDSDADPLPVRAANAFDIVLDRDTALGGAAAALTCTDRIDEIEDWASGLGFEQDIGALRQRLMDARGDLVASRVIDLARFYIYHGFGAEAAFWLSQIPTPPTAEMAMARHLDGVPGPNFPPVETLALCSGQDLLWRFVDADAFPDLSLRQRQEMRLALARLPASLRRMIGPEFVRRLAAAGHDDDAADVREALARGDLFEAADELLLALETTGGPPPPESGTQLADQMQRSGPDAVRALRQYLILERQAGRAADPGRVTAAEAYLRETDADRAPGGLWHEVLLAHALAGRSEAMFAMLDQAAGDAPDRRGAIRDSLLDALLGSDQHATLVVLASRIAGAPGGPALPRAQRVRLHDFLTAQGLATLAGPFAEPGRDRPDGQLPAPVPAGNWAAAAADTAAPEAAIAARLAALEDRQQANAATLDPTTLQSVLDDSRDLRGEIAALLGDDPPPDN